MKLYDALFYRRTVRKFKMEALDAEFINHLKCFVRHLTPYNSDVQVDFLIVDNSKGEIKDNGIFQIRAPYYLLLSSENSKDKLLNAGYLMQQVVLYLTAKGIGTCYQGNFRPTKEMLSKLKYDYCIAIAFGNPATRLEREPKEAVRLGFESIVCEKESLSDNVHTILEAARLAPSALNSQPWRFVAYNNRLHVFAKKNIINIVSDLRLLDIGIMLTNLSFAAEECGLKVKMKCLDNIAAKKFKNNEYVVSAILKE